MIKNIRKIPGKLLLCILLTEYYRKNVGKLLLNLTPTHYYEKNIENNGNYH